MKPAAVREAIVTGIDARSAWDGITLFRYPPGDRAEWRNGFILGDLSNVSHEDLDLSGATHQTDYELAGGLWVSAEGATDDDFKTVETAAIALVDDLAAWIVSVDHGKALTITGSTVDYLELTTWELTFVAEVTSAVVEFTLAVTEIG